ncbi:hypothetical protein FB451DRAFT_1380681 [Mycena latifolia]|nr:hypothetical protein FB451DRAFT_1380681 [Mycena latifolia]
MLPLTYTSNSHRFCGASADTDSAIHQESVTTLWKTYAVPFGDLKTRLTSNITSLLRYRLETADISDLIPLVYGIFSLNSLLAAISGAFAPAGHVSGGGSTRRAYYLRTGDPKKALQFCEIVLGLVSKAGYDARRNRSTWLVAQIQNIQGERTRDEDGVFCGETIVHLTSVDNSMLFHTNARATIVSLDIVLAPLTSEDYPGLTPT